MERSVIESGIFPLGSVRVSVRAGAHDRRRELAIRTRWKTLAVLLAADEREEEESSEQRRWISLKEEQEKRDEVS